MTPQPQCTNFLIHAICSYSLHVYSSRGWRHRPRRKGTAKVASHQYNATHRTTPDRQSTNRRRRCSVFICSQRRLFFAHSFFRASDIQRRTTNVFLAALLDHTHTRTHIHTHGWLRSGSGSRPRTCETRHGDGSPAFLTRACRLEMYRTPKIIPRFITIYGRRLTISSTDNNGSAVNWL